MLGKQMESIARNPPAVITGLLVIAICMFLAVTRLVNRFGEQEKALGRHTFEKGLAEQRAGNPELAIEDFRAALLYNRDDFQYQLSLAAALRDSGRTEESEAYLIGLWEAKPQDGLVNRALGRLAAREGSVDKAIQYYHNAIYGIWPTDAQTNRTNAEFELIDFLLRANSIPHAQAELIMLDATHPPAISTELRIASLFEKSQDYEHAAEAYREILRKEPENAVALAGLGAAAFHLGDYRTAETHLERAAKANPGDAESADLLHMTTMVLELDPFDRKISFAEQQHRVDISWQQAESRLQDCAKSQNIDLNQPSATDDFSRLQAKWQSLKAKTRGTPDREYVSAKMDLISEIEQQTARVCGTPSGMDQALLILSQERSGASR